MSRLKFVFFVTHDPPGYISVHSHQCHELVLYTSGSGHMTIDGTRYKYAPGWFTLTVPGSAHDERHYEPTDVLVIGFECPDIGVLFQNGLYADSADHSIHRLLEQIKSELLDKKTGYPRMLDLLVQQVAVALERLCTAAQKEFDDFFYIKQYIEENCSRKITIRDLAGLSGYSNHYFRHLFKQRCGLSPIGYLMEVRLKKAEQMLMHTGPNVADIAEQCGFSTAQQFIVIFKRIHGTTPAKFRKQQIDTNLC